MSPKLKRLSGKEVLSILSHASSLKINSGKNSILINYTLELDATSPFTLVERVVVTNEGRVFILHLKSQ